MFNLHSSVHDFVEYNYSFPYLIKWDNI